MMMMMMVVMVAAVLVVVMMMMMMTQENAYNCVCIVSLLEGGKDRSRMIERKTGNS